MLGAHALHCLCGNTSNARHNRAVTLFLDILKAAGASGGAGEVGVSTTSGRRGDGLFSHDAIGNGGTHVLDASVHSCYLPQRAERAASVQDATLIETEVIKDTKYAEVCEGEAYEGFLAVAIKACRVSGTY